MNKKIYFVLLFTLIVTPFAFAGKIDSLYNVLRRAGHDTARANSFNELASAFEDINKYDSEYAYANKALVLAEKLKSSPDEQIARAGNLAFAHAYRHIGVFYHHNGETAKAVECINKAVKVYQGLGIKGEEGGLINGLGNIYIDLSNYTAALDCYTKALKIGEQLNNKQLQADANGNMGLVFGYQGDYATALDYDLKALKIAEELGNKTNIAADMGNIGTIYWSEVDTAKAFKYFSQALKIDQSLNDNDGSSINLSDIGQIYVASNNYKKGLVYIEKALVLAKEAGDSALVASTYDNLGSIYGDYEHDHAKALVYFEKAMTLAKKIGEVSVVANCIGNIGSVYAGNGKFKDAEIYLKRALALDDSLGDKSAAEHYYESISQLYDTLKEYKLSLEYYKKAMLLKDSLFNSEKNKAITQKTMTYEFKKKEELEKADEDKKEALAQQEHKRDVIVRDFFIAGSLFLLILAFFIYRGYRDKKKDNEIITLQKELVEEKQKEILDSIHYAQRIQKALLASDTLLAQYLTEYFVLYKPKDIVSGDFYWATVKDGRFYLGVCDSTGHGVPGAFMSLLNISFMNEAITEKGIKKPNEVFNHTRKRLIENISQDGQQDGMDGTLLCFDKSTLVLEYAAAYNTPLVIRNGQLIELTGDKIPVGKSPKDTESFTYRSVELQKGDMVYAFTDGYADQFGGPKGKKFKSKHLTEKLLALSGLPVEKQKEELNHVLETWKQELEQVDDILVMGIRV